MTHPQAMGARFLRRLAPVALALALGAQEALPEPEEVLEPPAPVEATAADEVEPAAKVVRFTVDRPTVQVGEWVEFQWETRNAAWVVLEPLGIRLLSTGILIHRPPGTGTYWLSAVNGNGGQSWPLSIVVQPAQGPFPVQAPVLPAPPAPQAPAVPAIPAPAAPGAGVPAAPVPAQPSPAVPVPAGTPEPAPHGFWIQFGALSSRAAAQALLDRLDRTLDEPISIEVAGTERTFYRVHTGPYATRAQALAKLREARKAIPARLAKPLIVLGSPPVPEGPARTGSARTRRSRRG
jgi:cell division septation protein DedD